MRSFVANFLASNDRIVNAFLTKLEAQAILIANVPEEFHYERDLDEDIYINLAIVSNAMPSVPILSYLPQFLIGLCSHDSVRDMRS